jgi:hypothetical protein
MRFDHLVIGVRDLGGAREELQRRGFEVTPGGQHPGFGTENAIIRFGLDYVELIAIRDEAEAIAGSARGGVLVDFLRTNASGHLGYSLASGDLAAIGERLRGVGLAVEGPAPMRRLRPDGRELRWELLIPESVAWRRPWPFFISWAMPDAERLRLEKPGMHVNGAVAVSSISIGVPDLVRARVLYEAMLGAPSSANSTLLSYDVAGVAIRVSTRDQGPIGAGPFEFGLRLAPGAPARRAEDVLPGVRFTYEPST